MYAAILLKKKNQYKEETRKGHREKKKINQKHRQKNKHEKGDIGALICNLEMHNKLPKSFQVS